MSRPAYHRVYVVRFYMNQNVAYIRAYDITCDELFTHFCDAKGRSVHSLRTEKIVDISTKEMTTNELNETFPKRSNYIELKANKTATGQTLTLVAVRKLHS